MLILTHEANMSLHYAATFKAGLEVGGFGHTRIADNGVDVIVDSIYIPPQVVQAAHTDIKGPGEEGGDGQLESAMRYWASQCKWCRSTQEEHDGAGIEHDFAPQSWVDNRLWWHSHGSLSANPSHTDNETLQKLARHLEGWCMGLVINSKGESTAWAGIFQPPFNVLLNNVEVAVFKEERLDIKARIDEMMQHVEEKKYSYQGNQGVAHPTGGAKAVSGGATSGTGNTFRRLPLSNTAEGKRVMDLNDEDFLKWINGDDSVFGVPLLGAGVGNEE